MYMHWSVQHEATYFHFPTSWKRSNPPQCCKWSASHLRLHFHFARFDTIGEYKHCLVYIAWFQFPSNALMVFVARWRKPNYFTWWKYILVARWIYICAARRKYFYCQMEIYLFLFPDGLLLIGLSVLPYQVITLHVGGANTFVCN